MNEVYGGADAIYQYLTPRPERYIPLVELPESLNPYLTSHDIHISVKLMNTLPLANVKSIPAWNLLQRDVVSGKHVVESSSGNTVFSMGLLARHVGATGVKAIASTDVSQDKLKLLRLAGIDVQLHDGPICPDPNDPTSTITIARQLGEQTGWHSPGQYDNDANPAAHERITGPQLYDQIGNELGLYVAGLGTTGTLVGTARYLKRKLSDIKVGGVMRVPNNLVPGVRTRNGLREIAFDWRGLLTEPPVMVNEYDTYDGSLQLIRQGLLVGPSAGFAYKGTLAILAQLEAAGQLEDLRGKYAVFIAPDTCFPYVDDYFEVLGEYAFPAIDDQSSGTVYDETNSVLANVPELSVDEVYTDYTQASGVLDQPLHYELIDVRSAEEFADHSLPASINVPFDTVERWIDTADTSKSYVFICRRVGLSARAARMARERGLSAYVMTGGTSEWSAKGYERVVAGQCTLPVPLGNVLD